MIAALISLIRGRHKRRVRRKDAISQAATSPRYARLRVPMSCGAATLFALRQTDKNVLLSKDPEAVASSRRRLAAGSMPGSYASTGVLHALHQL